MTTKPKSARLVRSILLALPVLVFGWLAVLALVLRFGADAPAVFVPFPPETLLADLGDGVAVTGASTISLTLKSDRPDLVQAAYGAGAWLVLPAGLEACIPAFLRTNIPST